MVFLGLELNAPNPADGDGDDGVGDPIIIGIAELCFVIVGFGIDGIPTIPQHHSHYQHYRGLDAW